MDVIKMDFNQFVSPVQQILCNYLSEGREWVVEVVLLCLYVHVFPTFFFLYLSFSNFEVNRWFS